MRRFKGIVSSSGLAAGQIVLLDHSGAMQHRLVRTRGREEAMLQTALQQARRELVRPGAEAVAEEINFTAHRDASGSGRPAICDWTCAAISPNEANEFEMASSREIST